ncbi:hypothetical protein ID866_9049 [Astraeus odoratus]|nr:hypothetical protein ID866_9049 [Astraeus odoratus]
MAPSFPKFDRLRAFRTGFRQSPASQIEPSSEVSAGLLQSPKPTEPILQSVQSPPRKAIPLFDECAISCTDTLASDVLLGRDRVVCFSGTSQFAPGDVSTCSLAALNFIRVAFNQTERHQGNITDVLSSLATKKTMEEIVSIRAGWSSDIHLDVEDICRAPLFDMSLKQVATKYELPRPDHFKHVLQELRGIESCAAVIFTCTPETIACFKMQDHLSDKTIFVVFDPQRRRSHPLGAGLIFSTSMTQTALNLSRVLRTDGQRSSPMACTLQPQLLATGHIFTPKRQQLEARRAPVEPSVPAHSLRAEVVELKRQTITLTPEIQRLEAQVDKIRKERFKAEQAVAHAKELAEQERRLSSVSAPANGRAGSPKLPYIKRCVKPKDSRSNFNDVPQSPQIRPMSPRMRTSEDLSEVIERALKLHNVLDVEDTKCRRPPADPPHRIQCMFRCVNRCKQSAFVDRQDYDAMQNIVCPVRGCNHVWCKDCQQTVIVGGPKHICDGSAALDRLVKRKGWHYCPSVSQFPIPSTEIRLSLWQVAERQSRSSIQCIVPGCNTHFCYVCGGLIVRSALRDEVRHAIARHYSSKCLLFEVPGA